MHRHVRTTIAAAAVLLVAGLIAPTTAAASDAKRPVATDFSAGPKKAVVAPKKVIVAPKKVIVAPKKVIVAPRVVGPRVAPRVVGPRVAPRVVGPAVVGPRRISGPLILGGRSVTVIRGPRTVFWRGYRRTLIPLAAIGVITVGAVAYRAYAYVPVEQPICVGQTPDGCELRWQEVPTPEGILIPQCVQFCPPGF